MYSSTVIQYNYPVSFGQQGKQFFWYDNVFFSDGYKPTGKIKHRQENNIFFDGMTTDRIIVLITYRFDTDEEIIFPIGSLRFRKSFSPSVVYDFLSVGTDRGKLLSLMVCNFAIGLASSSKSKLISLAVSVIHLFISMSS